MHSVEKEVKERKEKRKKQDKIADVSDHAETRPEIAKGVRTKKKKKPVDSGSSIGPEPAPSNLEGKEKKKRKRDRDDEALPSGDKKRKKEKAYDPASDPASAILATNPSLEAADASEVTGTAVAASETKGKKKSKKNKSSAETSDPPPSAIEPTPSAGAADKPERLRKRKPAKDDTINAIPDTEPSSESKPKSKKRKKEKAVEDKDQSTVSPTEDSSRKRKKSKKSSHPDPSDDPDLTEQSRRALTYIYSQSTSPEAWKFSKARQNWIIRNVWTSKVPEKYVPMVVDYLSKVQGRVRETLIESCNKVISDSNIDSPALQAGTDEKGSSGGLNPPAPNTSESEKTQRAHILLRALSKKP